MQTISGHRRQIPIDDMLRLIDGGMQSSRGGQQLQIIVRGDGHGQHMGAGLQIQRHPLHAGVTGSGVCAQGGSRG